MTVAVDLETLGYYSMQPEQPAKKTGLSSNVMPTVYLLLGLILGYAIATGTQPMPRRAEVNWHKSLLQQPQQEPLAMQLYGSSSEERLASLQQQTDEQFPSDLDYDEDTEGEFDTVQFQFLLDLVERANAISDGFLQNLFGTAAPAPEPIQAQDEIPGFEMGETETEWTIKGILPPVKPEEMSVELRGLQLFITASKKIGEETLDPSTAHYITIFSHVFPVPAGVKPEDVSSSLSSNIFTVVIKKPWSELMSEPILFSN